MSMFIPLISHSAIFVVFWTLDNSCRSHRVVKREMNASATIWVRKWMREGHTTSPLDPFWHILAIYCHSLKVCKIQTWLRDTSHMTHVLALALNIAGVARCHFQEVPFGYVGTFSRSRKTQGCEGWESVDCNGRGVVLRRCGSLHHKPRQQR